MSQIDLRQYASVLFDCDGVLLDSNKIKTQAFFAAARPFGESAATRLVQYHLAHGGISRYRKFEHFLREIVGGEAESGALAELLAAYARTVREGLLSCTVAEGLDELREATRSARWLVVSGGDQEELRDTMEARGLTHLFDGGIYGSPASKDEILVREIASGRVTSPGVFFGDSKYDFEVASRFGLAFVFVSGWSEFEGWKELQLAEGFPHVEHVRSLIVPPSLS